MTGTGSNDAAVPGTCPGKRLIGLDFDNTIVLYDRVFIRVGHAMGLLPPGFSGGKQQVRDHIRAQNDGDTKWCRLQAQVYGPGIADAEPAPGILEFLARCRKAGFGIVVVSHKTETAAADPHGVNLRDAARTWMRRHGLTGDGPGGIAPQDIHFEATRGEKIARLAALGCSDFVDDLEEVFREPSFPERVGRHLLLHGSGRLPSGPFHSYRSWSDVADTLLAPPVRS
ncbi:hypothetical protein J2848_005908 [Azospirillum lipoferum]|uniref:hypothetical protein n=1 Tax=Azospirillum TaxID=191 RepID=UPI001479413D|nr:MULTISPECIES: hypothetical protein [Azospirillum]MCP1614205.1 hypothetical protein [Azospirillum lipoferum]MDW5536890.1 hypothetical protein [Azospirillum sp. NL1]